MARTRRRTAAQRCRAPAGQWARRPSRRGRAAIGARVEGTADGITATQEVDGGHGRFSTQRDLLLHFGLGSGCEATVKVRWPNRELSVEEHTLPAGYRYHLRQGEAPRPLL